jgi:hypothetical protein
VGVGRENAIEQLGGVAFWQGEDTEAEVYDVYPATVLKLPSVADGGRERQLTGRRYLKLLYRGHLISPYLVTPGSHQVYGF